MAMPLLALLAWVLAGGISAGVILRAAQTLGTPVAAGQRSDGASPLAVPRRASGRQSVAWCSA